MLSELVHNQMAQSSEYLRLWLLHNALYSIFSLQQSTTSFCPTILPVFRSNAAELNKTKGGVLGGSSRIPMMYLGLQAAKLLFTQSTTVYSISGTVFSQQCAQTKLIYCSFFYFISSPFFNSLSELLHIILMSVKLQQLLGCVSVSQCQHVTACNIDFDMYLQHHTFCREIERNTRIYARGTITVFSLTQGELEILQRVLF